MRENFGVSYFVTDMGCLHTKMLTIVRYAAVRCELAMREGAGAVAYADLTRLIDALPLSLYLARRSVPCRAAPRLPPLSQPHPLSAAALRARASQRVRQRSPNAKPSRVVLTRRLPARLWRW
jgi:hypothetical protein